MSTQRNRLLLAALGLIVVLYVGDIGYRKFYEEPMAAGARSKEQLAKRLSDAKLQLKKSTRAVEHLELLEKRALPADAELARARYRAWLMELAQQARLTNTSFEAGDPVVVTQPLGRRSRERVQLFRRITFTMNGRGDLNQITRFLYDFYNAGHLHKITSLSLNPLSDGQMMDMNLTIEALSLPTADRESELSQVPADQLALTDLRDYQLISRRNLFARGGAQWAWKQIKLTAVTFNVDGVGEAWFTVSSSPRTQIVPQNGVLTDGPVQLKVIRLDARGAVVEVDNQTYQLSIGQTLADSTAAPSPAPSKG